MTHKLPLQSHRITFNLLVGKATGNFDSKCSFFIHWMTLDGIASEGAQKAQTKKPINKLVKFNQNFQLEAVMLFNLQQKIYIKNLSQVSLKFYSQYNISQSKLAGKCIIDLADPINSQMHKRLQAHQLTSGVTQCTLQFSISVAKVQKCKQSSFPQETRKYSDQKEMPKSIDQIQNKQTDPHTVMELQHTVSILRLSLKEKEQELIEMNAMKQQLEAFCYKKIELLKLKLEHKELQIREKDNIIIQLQRQITQLENTLESKANKMKNILQAKQLALINRKIQKMLDYNEKLKGIIVLMREGLHERDQKINQLQQKLNKMQTTQHIYYADGETAQNAVEDNLNAVESQIYTVNIIQANLESSQQSFASAKAIREFRPIPDIPQDLSEAIKLGNDSEPIDSLDSDENKYADVPITKKSLNEGQKQGNNYAHACTQTSDQQTIFDVEEGDTHEDKDALACKQNEKAISLQTPRQGIKTKNEELSKYKSAIYYSAKSGKENKLEEILQENQLLNQEVIRLNQELTQIEKGIQVQDQQRYRLQRMAEELHNEVQWLTNRVEEKEEIISRLMKNINIKSKNCKILSLLKRQPLISSNSHHMLRSQGSSNESLQQHRNRDKIQSHITSEPKLKEKAQELKTNKIGETEKSGEKKEKKDNKKTLDIGEQSKKEQNKLELQKKIESQDQLITKKKKKLGKVTIKDKTYEYEPHDKQVEEINREKLSKQNKIDQNPSKISSKAIQPDNQLQFNSSPSILSINTQQETQVLRAEIQLLQKHILSLEKRELATTTSLKDENLFLIEQIHRLNAHTFELEKRLKNPNIVKSVNLINEGVNTVFKSQSIHFQGNNSTQKEIKQYCANQFTQTSAPNQNAQPQKKSNFSRLYQIAKTQAAVSKKTAQKKSSEEEIKRLREVISQIKAENESRKAKQKQAQQKCQAYKSGMIAIKLKMAQARIEGDENRNQNVWKEQSTGQKLLKVDEVKTEKLVAKIKQLQKQIQLLCGKTDGNGKKNEINQKNGVEKDRNILQMTAEIQSLNQNINHLQIIIQQKDSLLKENTIANYKQCQGYSQKNGKYQQLHHSCFQRLSEKENQLKNCAKKLDEKEDALKRAQSSLSECMKRLQNLKEAMSELQCEYESLIFTIQKNAEISQMLSNQYNDLTKNYGLLMEERLQYNEDIIQRLEKQIREIKNLSHNKRAQRELEPITEDNQLEEENQILMNMNQSLMAKNKEYAEKISQADSKNYRCQTLSQENLQLKAELTQLKIHLNYMPYQKLQQTQNAPLLDVHLGIGDKQKLKIREKEKQKFDDTFNQSPRQIEPFSKQDWSLSEHRQLFEIIQQIKGLMVLRTQQSISVAPQPSNYVLCNLVRTLKKQLTNCKFHALQAQGVYQSSLLNKLSYCQQVTEAMMVFDQNNHMKQPSD